MHQFRHLLLLAKILSANYFLCINNYTVDVATFTVLAKINLAKFSCNTQVLALAKFFSHEIFPLYGTHTFTLYICTCCMSNVVVIAISYTTISELVKQAKPSITSKLGCGFLNVREG